MKKFKAVPIEKANKILSYWLCEKKTIAIIIVSGFVYNGFMAAGPYFQGKMIDSLWEGAEFSATLAMAMAFFLSIAAVQFARYFKRFYVRRFANSTVATMRLMVYNNILSADLRELEHKSAGEMMTRIVSDVELCVEGMRKVTTEFFDTGVLLVSYLFVMAKMDLKLTAISCVFVPIAMLVAQGMKKLIYRCTAEFRRRSDINAAATLETLSHTLLYRQNGLQEQASKRYTATLDELEKSAVISGIAENSLQPLYKGVAMIGIVFMIICGGKNISTGAWTVGDFSAYLALFTTVSTRAAVAAKIFNSAQKSRISWLRLKPFLGEYSKNPAPKKLGEAPKIAICNLGFAYIGSAENAVSGVSFNAKAGDIIGVTGTVASGKSALGLALTGAYDYSGSIKLCGKELRDLSDFQKSSCIAYMGHAPELFSDTAANNILLGAEGLDISAVLHDVALDEDLQKMHETSEVFIGNGGISLSGGQQARMALARTLIAKKPLIILDDPFSAVDMKTEEKIMQNLRQNYSESIIIILSHRLRIFPHVSQVLFLQENAQPLLGTHEEIMQASKLYSDIFSLQEANGGEQHE